MEIRKQIYYCGVAGATAGVLAWYVVGQAATSTWENIWTSAATMGAGIGVLLVTALMGTRGFVEHWSGKRIWENLGLSVLLGAVAGALGLLVGQSVFISIDADWFGRVAGWLCLSLLVGMGQVGRDLSARRLIVGALAGVTAGLCSGLLYEGLSLVFRQASASAQMWASCTGLMLIGIAFGAGIPSAERLAAKAVVVVHSGVRRGSEYVLLDRLLIGSGEECRILIPDDPVIEQVHLEATLQGSEIQIRNLGNAPATLNDQELCAGQITICNTPCALRLGQTEFRLI